MERKYQSEKKDNTKVAVQKPIKPIKRKSYPYKEDVIYDTKKANFYRNMQNMYNSSVYGYGLYGRPTNYRYNTQNGQKLIQANYNNAKDNAVDMVNNLLGFQVSRGLSGIIKLNKSVFRKGSKYLGELKDFKDVLGKGAEAVVVRDTPNKVVKMTQIPVQEMKVRNKVPNTVISKYIGYVKNEGEKLPTYIQNRVKIIGEKVLPKQIKRLDKAMQKNDFRIVNDPQVQYRAYTNGKVVIDDISPGNIGLTSGNPWLDKVLPDFLKKPKIIDMAYQTVPEWLELGYQLKRKGGKLNVDSKQRS